MKTRKTTHVETLYDVCGIEAKPHIDEIFEAAQVGGTTGRMNLMNLLAEKVGDLLGDKKQAEPTEKAKPFDVTKYEKLSPEYQMHVLGDFIVCYSRALVVGLKAGEDSDVVEQPDHIMIDKLFTVALEPI